MGRVALFTLAPKTSESFLAIERRDPAAFDVIVAAIKHLARLSNFPEISSEGIFNQLVRGTAAA
jgi:hypothetical protein